jgi:pimeloyl-ACP methyl ester carboxylesterase
VTAAGVIAVAPDGVEIRATQLGEGPPLLILPPGMDDGRGYRKVAARLATRHRVVVLHRRQYRLDLPRPASMAEEVSDVLVLAEALGESSLVFGHSSGAVLALESVVARPAVFTGMALYEPPLPRETPNTEEALERARGALADGRSGRAMQIFTRDMVGLPRWQAALIGGFVALHPGMRQMAARQIADVEAMHTLGPRRTAYATIAAPTLLIGGDRSPGSLERHLGILADAITGARRVTLTGQGHSAQMRGPSRLADVITSFSNAVQR